MSSSSDSKNLQQSSKLPRDIQTRPPTAPVESLDGVMFDIGRNAITERAQKIRYATDEDMVWQASPSLILLVPRILRYTLSMIAIVWICSYISDWEKEMEAKNQAFQNAARAAALRLQQQAAQTKKLGGKLSKTKANVQPNPAPTPVPPITSPQPSTLSESLGKFLLWGELSFLGFFLLRLGWYALYLRTTKYSVSSQRLVIESGVLHSLNTPFELHVMSNAVITKPLLLRPFGLGNIVIAQPRLVLLGVRNTELVRDLLRQGGQLEAQRVDKIRWR